MYLPSENDFVFRTHSPPPPHTHTHTHRLKLFSSRPNSSLSVSLFTGSFLCWTGGRTIHGSSIQDMPLMLITHSYSSSYMNYIQMCNYCFSVVNKNYLSNNPPPHESWKEHIIYLLLIYATSSLQFDFLVDDITVRFYNSTLVMLDRMMQRSSLISKRMCSLLIHNRTRN
jgi:hypothetical protein